MLKYQWGKKKPFVKIFGGAKGSDDSDWEDSNICSRCGARKEFIRVG